ncbi:MAG: DnaA ATPase domain-containing protein, partial [Thermodesulfobacteriota bacterium]
MGKKSSLMNEETPYHAANSDNLDENFELINWDRILEKLNEKSNPQVFFWFSSLKLISQDAKSITLEAKSNFDKDWIENHYIDFINDTILEIYNRDCEIKVVSTQEISNTDTTKTSINKVTGNRAAALSGYINPAYSFKSFIVGSSNQFAHAASFAAAQKPGKAYNPLFIYGGVGLGKTHLINAIGNTILKNSQENLRVCCISAENFTNQV